MRLWLPRMANPERSLHINLVRSQSAQGIALASSGSSSCSICILGRCLVRAAEEFGEETRKPKTNRRHTSTDYANLALNDGPETSFEVVPGHVYGVCEVYKGAETENRHNSNARYR